MTTTTSPLSPALAASLPGPDWLQARRRRAAEVLADATWPTDTLEDWRYSPVDDLDLEAYPLAEAAGTNPKPVPIDERTGSVQLVDGHVASIELDGPHGLRLARAAELVDGEALLGDLPAAADPFSLAAAAFAPEPVVLHVPAGTCVEAPIVITHHIATGGVASFPHVAVVAEVDSEVTVLCATTSDDVAAVTVPRTMVTVGNAARTTVAELQLAGPAITSLSRLRATVGNQATLSGWTAGLGGQWARHRVDVALEGRGSSIDYAAAYFGTGDQSLDYRMFVDHVGADTTSNLRFKGVVDGRSTAVYTGMIRILPDARGSNAVQTNRNITLSEDAWAESVPNLEIENNEVRCSHASAVGPVDEDQLFYLESRGVPTDVATRLIVAGFFGEVVGDAPHPVLASLAEARIAALLDAREGSR